MFIKSTLQQLRCPHLFSCFSERPLPSARIALRFVATFYAFFQRLRRRLLFQVQDKCDSIKPCHASNTAKHAAVPRNLPLSPTFPLSHSHTDAKQKIAKLNISRVFIWAAAAVAVRAQVALLSTERAHLPAMQSDHLLPSHVTYTQTHTHTGSTGSSQLQ